MSGAGDLASKSQGVPESTKTKHKEETEDSYMIDKIRCLCGSSLASDSMIKVCNLLLEKIFIFCCWIWMLVNISVQVAVNSYNLYMLINHVCEKFLILTLSNTIVYV